jgi:predicted glycoside hydrolase/deacetylase ChbG (UPF0249 family)
MLEPEPIRASAQPKILVVNADDFGQSAGLNRGIIEAFEHGIVTSTSFMVNWPGAVEAARYARANPALAVGLHLDFGEWALRDGEWVELYTRGDLTNLRAVRSVAWHQLALLRDLLGAGPTHLDSHQHAHREEPIRGVAIAIARELGVPLRHFSPGIRYSGAFYGQDEHGEPYHDAITPAALIATLRKLEPGVTELACHPGYPDNLDTMYQVERAIEIRSLCDPKARRAIADLDVELRSFRDIRVSEIAAHAQTSDWRER